MATRDEFQNHRQWVLDQLISKLQKKYRSRFRQAWERGFLLKSDREYIIGHAYYEACTSLLRPVIIVNKHKNELSHLRIDMYPAAMTGQQLPSDLLARISAIANSKETEDFNISPGFVNILGLSSEIEKIAMVVAGELINLEKKEE